MAAKRRPAGPHKIGDKGLRHEHADRQTFQIGDKISIVVRRYAGRIVTTIDAPPELPIVIGEEIDLQKVEKP